jgi:hypothetical protein
MHSKVDLSHLPDEDIHALARILPKLGGATATGAQGDAADMHEEMRLPRRSAKLSHLGPPVPTLALPGLLAPPAKAAPPDFREESRETGAYFEGRRLILAWPTPAEPSGEIIE